MTLRISVLSSLFLYIFFELNPSESVNNEHACCADPPDCILLKMTILCEIMTYKKTECEIFNKFVEESTNNFGRKMRQNF